MLSTKTTVMSEQKQEPTVINDSDTFTYVRKALLDKVIKDQAQRISELQRRVEKKRIKYERLSTSPVYPPPTLPIIPAAHPAAAAVSAAVQDALIPPTTTVNSVTPPQPPNPNIVAAVAAMAATNPQVSAPHPAHYPYFFHHPDQQYAAAFMGVPPPQPPNPPVQPPQPSSSAPPDADKKQSRYWTPEEHKRFLTAVTRCGSKNYVEISAFVGTRNAKQVRTHAQKYQQRLEREKAKLHTAPGPPVDSTHTSLGAQAVAAVAQAAAVTIHGNVPGAASNPSQPPNLTAPTSSSSGKNFHPPSQGRSVQSASMEASTSTNDVSAKSPALNENTPTPAAPLSSTNAAAAAMAAVAAEAAALGAGIIPVGIPTMAIAAKPNIPGGKLKAAPALVAPKLAGSAPVHNSKSAAVKPPSTAASVAVVSTAPASTKPAAQKAVAKVAASPAAVSVDAFSVLAKTNLPIKQAVAKPSPAPVTLKEVGGEGKAALTESASAPNASGKKDASAKHGVPCAKNGVVGKSAGPSLRKESSTPAGVVKAAAISKPAGPLVQKTSSSKTKMMGTPAKETVAVAKAVPKGTHGLSPTVDCALSIAQVKEEASVIEISEPGSAGNGQSKPKTRSTDVEKASPRSISETEDEAAKNAEVTETISEEGKEMLEINEEVEVSNVGQELAPVAKAQSAPIKPKKTTSVPPTNVSGKRASEANSTAAPLKKNISDQARKILPRVDVQAAKKATLGKTDDDGSKPRVVHHGSSVDGVAVEGKGICASLKEKQSTSACEVAKALKSDVGIAEQGETTAKEMVKKEDGHIDEEIKPEMQVSADKVEGEHADKKDDDGEVAPMQKHSTQVVICAASGSPPVEKLITTSKESKGLNGKRKAEAVEGRAAKRVKKNTRSSGVADASNKSVTPSEDK